MQIAIYLSVFSPIPMSEHCKTGTVNISEILMYTMDHAIEPT